MGTFVTPCAIQTLPQTLPSAADQAADQHNVCVNEAPLVIAARQLVQLNLQYLALAATSAEFPDAITVQLRDICPRQRLRIADCRFSLFTLALNDSRRWLPLLHRVSVDTPLSLVDLANKAIRNEFATTAVFLAWHFAQSQPLAAKVLLGMDDSIAAALRRAPVARLRSIAHSAGDWLLPRWPQHPVFWPTLLRNTRDPTVGDGLAAAKCLGRQLLAAESLDLQLPPKMVGGCTLLADIDGGKPGKSIRSRRSMPSERARTSQR